MCGKGRGDCHPFGVVHGMLSLFELNGTRVGTKWYFSGKICLHESDNISGL